MHHRSGAPILRTREDHRKGREQKQIVQLCIECLRCCSAIDKQPCRPTFPLGRDGQRHAAHISAMVVRIKALGSQRRSHCSCRRSVVSIAPAHFGYQ